MTAINGTNITRRKNATKAADPSSWYKKYIAMHAWTGPSHRRCNSKMDLWFIFVASSDIRFTISPTVHSCLALLESLAIYKEKRRKEWMYDNEKKNWKSFAIILLLAAVPFYIWLHKQKSWFWFQAYDPRDLSECLEMFVQHQTRSKQRQAKFHAKDSRLHLQQNLSNT